MELASAEVGKRSGVLVIRVKSEMPIKHPSEDVSRQLYIPSGLETCCPRQKVGLTV